MGHNRENIDNQQNLQPPSATGGRLHGLRWRRGISGMPITIRLLLIIAFCLVPTIGLQVAVSWSQWAERKTQVGDLAARQAALLAGDVESIGEGARLLLTTAAEFLQDRTERR